MRILVVGGNGFIGRHLTEVLMRGGHEVVVFDKNPRTDDATPFVTGDVRDRDALRMALTGVDAVYNLAAEHQDDVRPRSLYYDVNVEGMRNLTAACSESGVGKILFTSTVACYGLDKACPDETAPLEPFNDYGISKARAEELLMQWSRREGNQAVIVRPTVVFGESNRGNVYNLLRQINRRLFPMVGEGENRKSMAYVRNVADFLAWANDNVKTTEIFNYADKPDFSTKELVALVRRQMGFSGRPVRIPYGLALSLGHACDIVSRVAGRPLPVSKVRVMKFCADTTIDSTKAFNAGFAPKYSLEYGLQQTIRNEFAIG